jgi:hypothetical protein
MKMTGFALSVLLVAGCNESTPEKGSAAGEHEGKSRAPVSARDSEEKEIPEAARRAKSADRQARPRKPPLASVAEGQAGKVISPFTNEVVDVSGRAAGDIVDDPRFPGDESKRFEIPQMPLAIPEARIVPGKPGFVFSPYNAKIIDVKGLKPGMLVADPTFPAEEKKHFRIPAEAAPDPGGKLLPEKLEDLPITPAPSGG